MAAIDLTPRRKALGMLVEASRVWAEQPEGSALKPHLHSAVVRSFEFTYELSIRMLRRVLIERAEAADLIAGLTLAIEDTARPIPPGVSLSDAEARTVLAIIGRCLPGAELWVFGSRATGRARPFSDLDLLLTSPPSLSWAQRVAVTDAFEASDLPFRVDLVLAAELSGGVAERVQEERLALPMRPYPLPIHEPSFDRDPVHEKSPDPTQRQTELNKARSLKMAQSAHAYVRGNTAKFYEWLDGKHTAALPQGPAIWICGDCHIGNLGPVANAEGKVEMQVRDFDQTVIGNPAHDLIRLGLSLSMAARSSDLPGVTTALMIEQMMVGYRKAFHPTDESNRNEPRPDSVQVALKEASRRTWRHLAQERLQGKTVRIPLGQRFWKVSEAERKEVGNLLQEHRFLSLVTRLRRQPLDAPVQLLDVAYWKKGCSSLGKLRYAAVLDVGGRALRGRDLCLIDIKEAVRAAAPRYANAEMPHEYGQRVVEGARSLSPHLGDRMAAARLGERSVFVRELLPQDLKLEIESITPDEACRAARYLARVVGRAHARQLDDAGRLAWKTDLGRGTGKGLDAPSWLWNSVVDLVGTHERGYLDHCRRFALDSARKAGDAQVLPARA